MAKKILIVENESIIALDEKDILEQEGYTCSIAYSGEKAINYLNKNPVDLILMDIDLGKGMDGTEAAEIILKIHDVPVVFISSYTDKEMVKKTEKITSYGYIVKESGATVLLASLRMAFQLYEANRKILEQKNKLEVSQFCLDNSGIGVLLLDTNGTINYMNKHALALHGYSEGEIIGRNITVLNPDAHPERWEYTDSNMDTLLSFEAVHIKKDGTKMPVSINSNNVKFGDSIIVITLIKDLTSIKEQKMLLARNKENIKTSKNKLKNVMELAHLGSWELDVKKNEFTFTDEFYSLFHTTAEEQGGYHLTPRQYTERFVHPDEKDIVAKETLEAIETDDPNFSKQISHKILFSDGGEGYITVRFFIVKDSNGKTIKTYGANQDITELKRNEERIQALLDEKEILLKEIHHRVKNNLRTIESLLSLQLASIQDDNAKATLSEARQRIGIMMNIYTHLSMQSDYQNVNVKIILLETLSCIARSYNLDSSIRINTDIIDCQLQVSSAINICIIVNELVTNSFKYAFAGRKTGEINVNLSRNGSGLVLSVTDNGMGISKEHTDSKTFGLGLSLVNSMIRNTEGSLDIQSDNGTKITVCLNKLAY